MKKITQALLNEIISHKTYNSEIFVKAILIAASKNMLSQASLLCTQYDANSIRFLEVAGKIVEEDPNYINNMSLQTLMCRFINLIPRT